MSTGQMLRGKVVMVGAPAVGKSSLVRRYVHSVFSDEYRSTLGVKIDRKTVVVDGWSVAMLLWDMHGETEGLAVPKNYLRGATGALVVVDAMRPDTAEVATSLVQRVREASPGAAVVCIANKSDLEANWQDLDEAVQPILEEGSFGPIRTSAKTGSGVDDAFQLLASLLVAKAT